MFNHITVKEWNMVKISKVKAHITDAMVKEEQYTKEEKDGNDGSDQAANTGATSMQPEEAALASFYARRHTKYQQLLARIHNFIIKMRTITREEKIKLKRQTNPMDDEQKEKVSIPVKLDYTE